MTNRDAILNQIRELDTELRGISPKLSIYQTLKERRDMLQARLISIDVPVKIENPRDTKRS